MGVGPEGPTGPNNIVSGHTMGISDPPERPISICDVLHSILNVVAVRVTPLAGVQVFEGTVPDFDEGSNSFDDCRVHGSLCSLGG
jgi:hypothetical protein